LIVAPIAPDSSRVAFLADTIVDDRRELFSVRLDGSESPRRLNAEHASLGPLGVREARMTPDGRSVVYTTYGLELYGAPIDASRAPQFLSQPGAYVDDFLLTTTGNRVVYRAQLVDDSPFDIFSAPIGPWAVNREAHPSTTRLRLARDVFFYKLAPDGTTVVYVHRPHDTLYRVDAAGGAPVRLVSHPGGFWPIPGGRVIFSPYGQPNGSEVFSMPMGGGEPVRLSMPLPIGPVVGRIHDFLVSPDGAWTVYLADGETQNHFELYSVPSDGSAPAAAISGTLPPNASVGGYPAEKDAFRITPDSTRVVYLADAEIVGDFNLYVAPIDGSAAPEKLTEFDNQGVEHGFLLSPDGQTAVFRALAPNTQSTYSRMVHSVPLDGGGPPVVLNGPFAHGATAGAIEISPDSAWVVYIADPDGSDRYELFSAPVDGSFAPIELQSVSAFNTDVTEHRISPDSKRVIYVLAQPDDQLYTIPIDGSAARRRFLDSGDLVDGFDFTPDGAQIVINRYVPQSALYRAPIDASTAPARLTPPPPSLQSIDDFHTTPDGAFALYVAWQQTQDRSELYRVPMDGSQTVVKLSGAMPSGADGVFHDLRVTEDGSRAVFVADALTAGLPELFSVPVLGGEAPVRLNGSIAPGGGGFELFLPPVEGLALRGDHAVYALDQNTPGLAELFAAPVGGGAPRRLNAPLQADELDTLPFQFAGPDRVVYLAPADIEGVPELFSTPIERAPRHASLSGSIGVDVLRRR